MKKSFKRKVIAALFCVVSLYPPIELTRYIIAYQEYHSYDIIFQIEIVFIWVYYLLALTIFYLTVWTKWED